MGSEKGSLRRVLNEFYHRTGIDGISQSADRVYWLKKWFWLIVFIVGMVVTISQVIHVLQDYLAYPSSNSVTLSSQKKVINQRISILF